MGKGEERRKTEAELSEMAFERKRRQVKRRGKISNLNWKKRKRPKSGTRKKCAETRDLIIKIPIHSAKRATP